ncbi:unnamed protein product [Sphagnum jensenii]|uniref:RING-type domain-containing protein n=1 Tax=Sphagnum jensenii TaxID=128206 RepID=A0ABP1API6_9BRYO
MAVQAQYPSNVLLPNYRNNRLPPATVSSVSFLFHFSVNNNEGGGNNELASTSLGSRKRAREADVLVNQRQQADVLVNQRQQQQQHQLLNQQQGQSQLQQHPNQLLNVSDYQNHVTGGSVVMPPSTSVSTGLRLAFEDDRLNSTSSASASGRGGNGSSPLLSIMGGDLSTQIHQESEEIELLFKAQGEQVRQLLEEKRQRHSRELVAAIEQGISRRFQEKDLEIETMKIQNLELAEHVKRLSLAAHHWRAKAETNEAIVTALRSNLQQAEQAVAFSREQSKEGCGDSEADDAASSHNGDDAHARTLQENRELREQRTCRVCRCNDVSMLLLPCRHLCLCKDCETRLDACPLCRSRKQASVQVYMS